MKLNLVLFCLVLFSCNSSSEVEKTILDSTCEEAQNQAIKDASNGVYKLHSYGLMIRLDWEFQKFYEDYMLQTYSIDVTNAGCETSEGTKCYAKKMNELVEQKFGADVMARAQGEAEKQFMANLQEKIDSGFVFQIVDSMPSFIGGDDQLKASLDESLSTQKSNVGEYQVSFVVEVDGSVSNVEMHKSSNKDANETILEAIRTLPNFTPAQHYGKSVRCQFVLPLNVE